MGSNVWWHFNRRHRESFWKQFFFSFVLFFVSKKCYTPFSVSTVYAPWIIFHSCVLFFTVLHSCLTVRKRTPLLCIWCAHKVNKNHFNFSFQIKCYCWWWLVTVTSFSCEQIVFKMNPRSKYRESDEQNDILYHICKSGIWTMTYLVI